MLSDEQIIKGCIKKQRNSQRELYQRYSEAMRVVCLRYSRTDSDAEDMLQESFLKVFDHIQQYAGIGSIGGWIHRIVVNTAISFCKQNYKVAFAFEVEIPNQEDDESSEIDFDAPLLDRNNQRQSIENAQLSGSEILAAVQQLPDGYRMVFNLYAIEGYKHRDIADTMGIDPSTSKSQLARARKLLQSILFGMAVQKADEAVALLKQNRAKHSSL